VGDAAVKTFAQFFTTPECEATGSDQIAVLDGRHSRVTNAMIARSICRVRGYAGFELRKGKSFSRAQVIRKLELVNRI